MQEAIGVSYSATFFRFLYHVIKDYFCDVTCSRCVGYAMRLAQWRPVHSVSATVAELGLFRLLENRLSMLGAGTVTVNV